MILSSVDDTEAAGALLADVLCLGDVVALYGDLGAGKTSFVRGLLHGLGLSGDVPSPSFGLIIPYEAEDIRLPVWHIDLYRLDDPDEVDELALDEARADYALLIEWPERMGSHLWPDALQVRFEREGEGRRLTVVVPPSWEGRCPYP
jgi:tRNA threonylcarbamoyladenosine biosynthesis protein TsaE